MSFSCSSRFKSIIGIGVGAGAYVLAKLAVSQTLFPHCAALCPDCVFTLTPVTCVLLFQLIFPDLVEGLVLLNIDPNGKGWIDWAATKVPPLLCTSDTHNKSRLHLKSSPCLFLQLSGLTSALPDTVLPHLFSQVGSWCGGKEQDRKTGFH